MRRRAPDFVGIGAQKAGTTWLWQVLRSHPGVWLPPRKELHYFDRAPRYESPDLLATTSPVRRWLGRAERDRRFRGSAVSLGVAASRRRDRAELAWVARYATGRIDDDWYLSLFPAGASGVGDRLRGEITPAYSMLDDDGADHLLRVAHGAKLLLLLRDPVERAWSHLRFRPPGGAGGAVGLEEATAFLLSPAQVLRSDYPRMLERWESRVGPDRLHVAFYDDIAARPEAVADGVFGYLGLDPAAAVDAPLGRRFNASPALARPAAVDRLLAEHYLDDLVALAQRFGGHPASWLASATAVLAAG